MALNAGVGVGGHFATETDLDEELNLINLDGVSTVHPARDVVRHMVAQGRGNVLLTAWIAGTMPTPREASARPERPRPTATPKIRTGFRYYIRSLARRLVVVLTSVLF